jgi:hypothetical protein
MLQEKVDFIALQYSKSIGAKATADRKKWLIFVSLF